MRSSGRSAPSDAQLFDDAAALRRDNERMFLICSSSHDPLGQAVPCGKGATKKERA
jgi:hypothetical protein